MRAHGFGLVTMGRGGPGKDADGNPAASLEDQERAIGLNRAWDQVRSGQLLTPARTTLVNWPEGSVGHGYQRAMELRKADRLAKGVVWTSRQEKRDSWPRAWKWLIRFGDCDPRTIMPEHFLRIDPVTGKATGLVAEIESAVSRTERHMTIKVWRALWKRMQAMHGYCDGFADPSLAFANSAPDPRQEIWLRREVLKLVQVAWRNGFCGLAACMAVAWDSMLSPIDARSLTQGQASRDGVGLLFTVARAKTGKAAAATLSRWSQAILIAYLDQIGAEMLDSTPLFWTRGGRPVSRKGRTGQWGGDHGGGRHITPRPYTERRLQRDFATVRALAFGQHEQRQLADMRRSGAVEGDAGGGSVTDQSNKMANTVSASNRLRLTIPPMFPASVASTRLGWSGRRSWNEKRTKVSQRRPL
jgi:hypothetical protein